MEQEISFVLAGLVVCGVWCVGVTIFLVVWAGLHRIRTPKPKRG